MPLITQNSQDVAVLLNFVGGSFDEKFPITMEIYVDGRCEHQETNHELPSASDIPEFYSRYVSNYKRLGLNFQDDDFKPVEGHVSSETAFDECLASAKALESALIKWFGHLAFKSLGGSIRTALASQQDRSIPIIFNFSTRNSEVDNLLRKLPWHLWSLFKELDQAEVALSTGPSRKALGELKNPVRVLAVFGSDPNNRIDLNKAQENLEELLAHQRAHIKAVKTYEDFHTQLTDEKGWDILLYTGHSNSDLDDGYILLDGGRSVALSVLEEDFRQVLKNGLKLAIFNSCNGLGIANFFAGWTGSPRFPGLPKPNIIVMREPVPDYVAQEFFEKFLKAFANGKPIHKAVRDSRRDIAYLHGSKNPYPNASWLPVICLSRNQPDLVWVKDSPLKRKSRLPILSCLVVGVAAAITVAAVHAFRRSTSKIDSSLSIEQSSIGGGLITPEVALLLVIAV